MSPRGQIIADRGQVPSRLTGRASIHTTPKRGVTVVTLKSRASGQPIIGITAERAETFRAVLYHLLSDPSIKVVPPAWSLTDFASRLGPQLEHVAVHRSGLLSLNSTIGSRTIHQLGANFIFNLRAGRTVEKISPDMGFALVWAQIQAPQKTTLTTVRGFYDHIVTKVDDFDELSETPLMPNSPQPLRQLAGRSDLSTHDYRSLGVFVVDVTAGALTNEPYVAVTAADTYTLYRLLSRALTAKYFSGIQYKFDEAFAEDFNNLARREHSSPPILDEVEWNTSGIELGDQGLTAKLSVYPPSLHGFDKELGFAKCWFTFRHISSGPKANPSELTQIFSRALHRHAGLLIFS